jgi:tyrosine-specific transport protein
MQGTIARGTHGRKLHRATPTCGLPATQLLRVRVPRSLRRCGCGKWCVAAAAAGDGARAVARPDRKLADARPEEEARSGRALRPGVEKGSVALIVGTSIGSGILAVPQRTAPAVSSVPTNSSSAVITECPAKHFSWQSMA